MGRAIWEQFYFRLFQNLEILHGHLFVAAISMETTHDPKESVLLIALNIMRHAKLCLLDDHVPYLRVLAPRKDVQGTVYLWAEGASLTC